MADPEEKSLEKEAEQIEAELGEDHLVRMLQCLTSSSPEAIQGLVKLHAECRDVISKRPPIKVEAEVPRQKRASSQGTTERVNGKVIASSVPKVRTQKPRIMMTKRPHLVMPHNVQKNIAA